MVYELEEKNYNVTKNVFLFEAHCIAKLSQDQYASATFYTKLYV